MTKASEQNTQAPATTEVPAGPVPLGGNEPNVPPPSEVTKSHPNEKQKE